MTELYKPKYSITLDQVTNIQPIRLGIQSPPGKGKTHAALTFPNPVVANFNKGLGAHLGRADVTDVPFWNGAFCDKWHPRDGLECPANKKDAFEKWLLSEGMKLSREQTFVVDSNTEVEAAFHIQYAVNGPRITAKGAFDKWDEWKKKGQWYSYIIDIIKSLPCNVVYITHEIVERTDDGDLTGRAKPLLTGQAGDKIVGDFADWFRQFAIAKPINPEQRAKFKERFCNNDESICQWMLESTPKEHTNVYLWQIYSDEKFELKTSSLFNAPKFVVSNYTTFIKYKHITKEKQ